MNQDPPKYVPPSDATVLRYLKQEKRSLAKLLKREVSRKAKIALLRKECQDLSDALYRVKCPEDNGF
jgi:hypothetical protein